MRPEYEILIEALALTDATWAPARSIDWHSEFGPANLYLAQRDYCRSGIPWASGRSSAIERQRSHRELARLAAEGLLSLFDNSGRTVAMKLTERGETVARSLAGLPSICDAHVLTGRLVKFGGKLWVNELVVWTGRRSADYGPATTQALLWQIQATFSPALVHHYVLGRSDCDGRVYLMATADGIAWASGPPPALPDDLPATDESAQGAYFGTWNFTRRRFQTTRPADPAEIGQLPLPVSGASVRAADGVSDAPLRRRKKP